VSKRRGASAAARMAAINMNVTMMRTEAPFNAIFDNSLKCFSMGGNCI
jgi:hypothetical protein